MDELGEHLGDDPLQLGDDSADSWLVDEQQLRDQFLGDVGAKVGCE